MFSKVARSMSLRFALLTNFKSFSSFLLSNKGSSLRFRFSGGLTIFSKKFQKKRRPSQQRCYERLFSIFFFKTEAVSLYPDLDFLTQGKSPLRPIR